MDYEDQRNRCCCNIQVLKGANIIAFVGIGLAVTAIGLAILTGRYYFIIGAVAFILLYGSIIYALHVRNATYYWGYLIANGIGIILCSFYIIFLLTMFLMMPHFWLRYLNEITNYQHLDIINKTPRLVTAGAVFVMLLIQSVNIWFELVIYNASQFLRREQFQSQNIYKA